MSFDAFIEAAWNDHGERPGEVADRLAGSLALIASAADVLPFARIATHVYGEHLGRWQEGVDLLESIRRLRPHGDDPVAAGAIGRAIATLRYAAGERDALAGLSPDDCASALASAAAALAARDRFGDALTAYALALHYGARLAPGSPAERALAVGGNNLAASLEGKAARSVDETAGMVAAAEAALKYWRLAGTWLEEERALYRLARSRMQAGAHAGAVESAAQCITVCERHDAPSFERFFGYAALAMAQRGVGDAEAERAARSQALRLLEAVAPDERPACEPDLRELEA